MSALTREDMRRNLLQVPAYRDVKAYVPAGFVSVQRLLDQMKNGLK